MEVFFTPGAEKFIRQLTKSNPLIADKIIVSIEKLANNEVLSNVKKITTHQKGEFKRIRIGDYRVICCIDKDLDLLIVTNVGTRQSVYEIFNRQK